MGPHTKDKTKKVEKVQRRAARVTLSDDASTTSATQLLFQLDWQTLEERRTVPRLSGRSLLQDCKLPRGRATS